jgi:subtilisin family serine protease
LPHESLPREGQTVQSPPILGAWNGPRPPAPPRRERPDGGIDADGAWREKRGDILQRRAAQREIHRREAAQELARRGITLDDLRIMTPQERAAVLQGLREHLHARAQPGWRLRMMERRRAAQGDLEQGQMGRRHVRAQILAVDPSAAALNSARDNGFRVMRERRLSGLGVRIYVLAPPPGMPVQNALDVLRRADPAGSYDLNHVFDPSAASRTPGANGLMPGRAFDGRGVKIGVVDTGVARQHPALATARITERAFVETTGARETGHGTAIAALLVGDGDGYQGVIPGAHLFVADVFGSTGAGGSAEAIVDALAWLDVQDVDVINISLEGPPNRTLEAVINALVRRGRIIVAAVGNQGPTQPVAYPAAYDGVIGVTAIDVERRIYIAANRGAQVDFAALGVGVLTADGVGYDTVSGTSFAAPMVAATVAALSKSARLPQARLAALTARARDLGSPGRDPVYGDGAIEPGAAP